VAVGVVGALPEPEPEPEAAAKVEAKAEALGRSPTPDATERGESVEQDDDLTPRPERVLDESTPRPVPAKSGGGDGG
jgi:hypothetical protein